MGIFNRFKSNTTNEPKQAYICDPASTQPNAYAGTPVNLTKNGELNRKISLRKEIVLDEVKKKNISSVRARVVFVLDHSGSMRNMYKNGTVQNLLERIFPIAMCFDDNAEMEFYWFDSHFKELEPVNYYTIDGYVQKVILSQKDRFGSTYYSPIMEKIVKRYGESEPMNIPTFVIFITDGNNSDKASAKNALTKASYYNIFWKFVGIGNEKFDFLNKLDNLNGRLIDNANFVEINDINAIDDRTLYSELLTEYNDWLMLCRKNNIPV